MLDYKQPFDVALAVTRAGNLFTTHTPVEAGFDRFSPELMQAVLRRSMPSNGSASAFDDLLALGRRNPTTSPEPFNMAYLAMRGSGAVNGVSRLHGAGQPANLSAAVPALAAAGSAGGPRHQRRSRATWESADAA